MARKSEFYEGLRDAMLEGVAALRAGRELTRRDAFEVPVPDRMTKEEIVVLRRERLRVSQHVFARLLNVAPTTVQAWEQGRNVASGATLRLLRLAEKDPSILLRMVAIGPRRSAPRLKSRRRSTRTVRA